MQSFRRKNALIVLIFTQIPLIFTQKPYDFTQVVNQAPIVHRPVERCAVA